MYKLDLEKAEEPEIKLPTSVESEKKQGNSRKTSTASLTMLVFDCVDHNKVENSSGDGNTRPPDLPPEESVCRSRSKLEPDMEQQTGSKSGKEYIRGVYCLPAYLIYMQSISCKMPGWMKHKLESSWEKYQ